MLVRFVGKFERNYLRLPRTSLTSEAPYNYILYKPNAFNLATTPR